MENQQEMETNVSDTTVSKTRYKVPEKFSTADVVGNYRTTVYLPLELKRPFAALMIARGSNMSQFFVGCIRRELSTLEAKGEIGELIPTNR